MSYKSDRLIRRCIGRLHFFVHILGAILLLIFVVFYFSPFKNKLDNLILKVSLRLGDYQKCTIYGSENVKLENIYDALPKTFSFPLAQININDIYKKICAKSWVMSCSVHKVFPNSLVIKILEKDPIALWKTNEMIVAIDKCGNAFEAILSKDYIQNLPYLIGEGANLNANNLISILKNYHVLQENFFCGIYIGFRRWDIILKDGTLIKLPEKADLSDACNKASEAITKANPLCKKIEIIDLRNENKIYITYHLR
jgi:cell division protein FtsQ